MIFAFSNVFSSVPLGIISGFILGVPASIISDLSKSKNIIMISNIANFFVYPIENLNFTSISDLDIQWIFFIFSFIFYFFLGLFFFKRKEL